MSYIQEATFVFFVFLVFLSLPVIVRAILVMLRYYGVIREGVFLIEKEE